MLWYAGCVNSMHFEGVRPAEAEDPPRVLKHTLIFSSKRARQVDPCTRRERVKRGQMAAGKIRRGARWFVGEEGGGKSEDLESACLEIQEDANAAQGVLK